MARAAHHLCIEDAGNTAHWLILVHGFSQDHRLFDRQVARFRSRYRLALFDLPGHGGSGHLPGPYGPQELADAVREGIAECGITRAHYWGTHTGTATGLLLAAAEPDLVISLILEGPVFPGDAPPSVTTTMARVRQVLLDDGIAAARQRWWDEGPWFDYMRTQPERCRATEQRALIDDFAGAPWRQAGVASSPVRIAREDLANLHTPTLIINGEHEVPDFLPAADDIAKLLPDCQRAVVPDAGGFPLWENAGAVNDLVQAFLENQRSPASA